MKDKKPYVPPRTMEMPAQPKMAAQVTPDQVSREAQKEALQVKPGEIEAAQNLILQKGESAREDFVQADARKERVFDCVGSAVKCIKDSDGLADAKTKFFQGQKGKLGTGEVEAAEQIFDEVYVNMQEMQYEDSEARPTATQTEAPSSAGKGLKAAAEKMQGGSLASAAKKMRTERFAGGLVTTPLEQEGTTSKAPSMHVPSDEQLRAAGLSAESIKELKERVQAIKDDPEAMQLARNAMLSPNKLGAYDARAAYMTYLGVKPASQFRQMPFAHNLTDNRGRSWEYQGPDDPKTAPIEELMQANKDAHVRMMRAAGREYNPSPDPEVDALCRKLAELNPEIVYNAEEGYIVNEAPMEEFDPRTMEHGLKNVPMPDSIEEGFLRAWHMPSQAVTEYQRGLYLGYGPESGKRYLRRTLEKKARMGLIDKKMGEGTADQLGQFQRSAIADIYDEARERPDYCFYKPEMVAPKDLGEAHFKALCNANQFGLEAIDPEIGAEARERGFESESFHRNLQQAFWDVNPHRTDHKVEATPEVREKVTRRMIEDFGLEDDVRMDLRGKKDVTDEEMRDFSQSVHTGIEKKYG